MTTVNLISRRFVIDDDGIVLIDHPVAVGRPERPTPIGLFTVTGKHDFQHAPSGPLGAYSIELTEDSAFDPRKVVVCGSADPAEAGRAVTDGQLRLPNDVMLAVAHFLPTGAAVNIGDEPK